MLSFFVLVKTESIKRWKQEYDEFTPHTFVAVDQFINNCYDLDQMSMSVLKYLLQYVTL